MFDYKSTPDDAARQAPIRQRCPGCYSHTDRIQALAVYVHKATGKSFSYSLCPRCARDLRRRPEKIAANVEAYYSEEIAAMDAEAAAKAVAK